MAPDVPGLVNLKPAKAHRSRYYALPTDTVKHPNVDAFLKGLGTAADTETSDR